MRSELHNTTSLSSAAQATQIPNVQVGLGIDAATPHHDVRGAEIMEFIPQRLAQQRWGMSDSWFEKQRLIGTGPPFVRIGRKILYPIREGDAWFRSRMSRQHAA